MEPILLIHGYSSEGKGTPSSQIYGSLPSDLRKAFGNNIIKEIDLSRWISLSDGIALDDVSFAMERALRAEHAELFTSGFHVIIHSTGALVVRNWIRLFSPKPSPIRNLVHLAGANFGSGLAHIGQGQLARWGRLIFEGTGSGMRVLDELEFGSWKTLDLHIGYLRQGNDMYADYRVQEFCLIGSQTLPLLNAVPIRYVKEDSSDNTVRTSACNLNFNYVAVKPKLEALNVDAEKLGKLIESRLWNQTVESHYDYDLSGLCANRPEIPFSVIFETAHFGGDIGIVSGANNRQEVLPLIKQALETPYDKQAYEETAKVFRVAHANTFERAAELTNIFGWNKQEQYEGHAQLIFRLRDQFGVAVEHFDITFKSQVDSNYPNKLEDMLEDKHNNSKDVGTLTFYLRTQAFENNAWRELLHGVGTMDVEITGHEPLSGDIDYLPLSIRLGGDQVRAIIQSFRTTIIDVTLMRLPSDRVFAITKG